MIHSTPYTCRHCPSQVVVVGFIRPTIYVFYCYRHYQAMRHGEGKAGWRYYPKMRCEWLTTRLVRRPTEMEMQLMKAGLCRR